MSIVDFDKYFFKHEDIFPKLRRRSSRERTFQNLGYLSPTLTPNPRSPKYIGGDAHDDAEETRGRRLAGSLPFRQRGKRNADEENDQRDPTSDRNHSVSKNEAREHRRYQQLQLIDDLEDRRVQVLQRYVDGEILEEVKDAGDSEKQEACWV